MGFSDFVSGLGVRGGDSPEFMGAPVYRFRVVRTSDGATIAYSPTRDAAERTGRASYGDMEPIASGEDGSVVFGNDGAEVYRIEPCVYEHQTRRGHFAGGFAGMGRRKEAA